jgi:hypothetical protein
MTRFAFPVACVALLLSLAGARPAPAPEADGEVKAIVAKAIEARGGAANLARFKAMTAKFNGTMYSDDSETKFSGTQQEIAPEKVRMDASMRIGCEEVSTKVVFDGTKGWRSLNGNVVEMTKEEADHLREDRYVSWVAGLRGLSAKGIKLAPLGKATVAGKPAVGIRVSCEGHPDVSLYFDKATGLIAKRVCQRKDTDTGAAITEEVLYSDFKNVSGLMIPCRMTVNRDGKPYQVGEWLEVTLSENLPEGTFAKP